MEKSITFSSVDNLLTDRVELLKKRLSNWLSINKDIKVINMEKTDKNKILQVKIIYRRNK